MKYNKLVRDKIPQIITKNGQNPVTRVLNSKEKKQALLEKLIEEAKELLDDPSLGERADVAEVLQELDKALGFGEKDIEAARVKKYKERGGFKKGIFLERAED